MDWTTFSHIADILGVLSFVISLGIFRKILTKTECQKETYINERKEFLAYLRAIQNNIWSDNLASTKIQDLLQMKMFEYQMKYLFISSPRCIFHVFRCSYLLKKGITSSNTVTIRHDVNFIIARLTKKE